MINLYIVSLQQTPEDINHMIILQTCLKMKLNRKSRTLVFRDVYVTSQ